MELLTTALNQNGFNAKKPKGSFFLYVTAPKSATFGEVSTEFHSGEAFSQWLITNELISTVPWDDCGNFVRFSVTFAAKGVEKEKEIVKTLRSALLNTNLYFSDRTG
jgi:LL-diaminopimelate aminotransferase